MSKARDLADFGSNPDEQTSIITVTVAGGKFVIDGTSQQTITMAASGVYKFDQSHSSNASHPLKISTTSDGTHGGGSAITVDFVAVGTAGSAGAYVTYTIQQDGADNYFYYCGNHSGMGGSIRKSGNPTAAEILTSIKTVDGNGSGLDADTLDGVEAAALLPLSGGTMTGDLAVNKSAPKITFSDTNLSHSADFGLSGGTVDLKIDTAASASHGKIRFRQENNSSLRVAGQFDFDGSTDLYHAGDLKFTTSSSGVGVTGDIAVTGTVDGRDVAADGTKLDTNIPSSLGAAGQVLTVNPAGTAAWATVSSDPAAVVFPSDWASPTNTYTSSGTWSKGSLSDDDYVWFFLLGGGGGGAEVYAAAGGSVRLIYGKAELFNGAAYAVGADTAGTNQNVGSIAGNPTTLTLTSANGSSVLSTPTIDTDNVVNVVTAPSAAVAGTYLNGSPAEIYSFQTTTLPSGYTRFFTGSYGYNLVFGGAHGQAPQLAGNTTATSLLSGNGGTTASRHGVSPGGGGAAGQNAGGTGGTGAAGNVRVYHV